MSSVQLNFERRGPIVLIRLNRPEKFNALTPEMIAGLTDFFEQRTASSDRAIILTGTAKAFCAGTDIQALTEQTPDAAREISQRGQRLCNAIESSPLPVIAAINGLAAGGGFELALSCHLRIASTGAVFSLPEARLGIIPAYGGTQRLAREIGAARARELMITGSTISAEQALRIGLINRVCTPDELLPHADSLASDIAQLAPLAISACLRAVKYGLDHSLEDGLAFERELFASLFSSNDVREGTTAFLQKRKPSFNGT